MQKTRNYFYIKTPFQHSPCVRFLSWLCSFYHISVLDIPEKHKFTFQDAIINHSEENEILSNSIEDNVQSEQFNIFNFLQNVRLPKIPLLDNMIKRPQGPPPPPPAPAFVSSSPQFSPNPDHQSSNAPNLESANNHRPSPHEALTIFNAGLSQ